MVDLSEMCDMSFTGSRTCLMDHELTCAGVESEDTGHENHFSSCARIMEPDWDSCSNNSSSAASQNSSIDSSESLCLSPPQPPSHPEACCHHHQQQQQQQRPSGRLRTSASEEEEEVMFFQSGKGVWDSLAYITSLTDMCDVVFNVGKACQPVYGIKSLLSVRSRVMYLKILQAQRSMSASLRNSRKCHKLHNDVRRDSRVHVDVKDYDIKVFSQLIGFLHSGRVKVDANTVLGLYCAAAEYDVPDLRTACWDFVDRCIQRNQMNTLLMSDQSYLGRKCLDKLRNKFFKM